MVFDFEELLSEIAAMWARFLEPVYYLLLCVSSLKVTVIYIVKEQSMQLHIGVWCPCSCSIRNL
jgi:hypothetical protein